MQTLKKVAVKQTFQAKKQSGSSFWGTLIVVAAIGFFGLVGLKLFSSYSEFYSVKSALKAMKSEPLDTMSKNEIKASFDRRAIATYITTVTGQDLKIEKEGRETVVSVNYQVVKPIVANISVVADFAASTRDQ